MSFVRYSPAISIMTAINKKYIKKKKEWPIHVIRYFLKYCNSAGENEWNGKGRFHISSFCPCGLGLPKIAVPAIFVLERRKCPYFCVGTVLCWFIYVGVCSKLVGLVAWMVITAAAIEACECEL